MWREFTYDEFIENEVRHGDYILKLIKSKPINRACCTKYGILLKRGEFELTPQEQLFANFFSDEMRLVKDMDILTLRAHRETISGIAYEAKARLRAIDEEEKDRKKAAAKRDGKPTGFERSVNVDETTTDAINAVKARQKKMTKMEKVANILSGIPGFDQAAIDHIMSAKTVSDVVNKVQNHAPPSDVPAVNVAAESTETKSFNPFAK